jgi:hypothetical protein
MVFAYVKFMYEALFLSSEALAKAIPDVDKEVYGQFKVSASQLKDRLGLIAAVYLELPESMD